MITHSSKRIFIPLKGFMALLVVTALLSLLPLSAAAQGGGTTPTTATPLAERVNSGTLAPTGQHWYTFTPDSANIQQFLTLVATPNSNNSTIRFVTLKVFEGNQIQFFAQGSADNMAVFGEGQIVTRDNDPNTGERLWSGVVSAPTTYYIQVLNESDFTVDYQLFNASVGAEEVEEPQQPEVAAQPEEAAQVAAPPEIAATSNDPGLAVPLQMNERGRAEGRLAPNSTYWYTLSLPNLGENKIQDLKYTMFFTPDDGNRKHRVNFELYPYSEFELWRRGDGDDFTNFGAGMLIDRDGDYNTGERLWSGSVLKGDQYLLSISNGNDVPIDYYLYEGDIINPLLGPEPVPAPPPVFAQGVAPQTAQELKIGVNKGKINPGGEAWYSFSIADLDEDKFEEMALTMVATPDDGNRIRNITFDVFTADGVKYWSPGDNSNLRNLGAGSVVYRDNNFLTGERFWTGWVNDGDLYYVQIRNGTDVPVDYHLFTGDVYGPELGEKTQPVPRKPAAPGAAPYAPVELKVGVTDDQLKPGEERWYTFSRNDTDSDGRVETIFTMVFTPDDGNRKHRVNFELFEGNQLRDWAPDNRFNLKGFGGGSIVERDGGYETGELIWRGVVLDGNLYYMRVYNESDQTIDYKIFPEDVINTSLSSIQ